MYKVLAPYVTMRVNDRVNGGHVLLGYYAGAPVPDDVLGEDLERLLRKGMVVDADTAVGELLAVPAGTPIPGEPPNVPVEEIPVSAGAHDERVQRQVDALEAAGPAETGGRPKDYGSKGEWVDYAVSRRGDDVSEFDARAAAELKTKDTLIAEHG